MRWIAIVTLLCFAGCSAFRSGPKGSVLKTFDDADRFVANGHDITDPEILTGLREIYRSAKWRPLVDTEPLDQISIEIYRGDQHLGSFTDGAGWLMEESRKGILDKNQHKWMRGNIVRKSLKINCHTKASFEVVSR